MDFDKVELYSLYMDSVRDEIRLDYKNYIINPISDLETFFENCNIVADGEWWYMEWEHDKIRIETYHKWLKRRKREERLNKLLSKD